MGVPLLSTKLIAFATGASFSGAMGALFAAKQTFISPESFNFDASVGILAMVVLGGLGSIQGALLGAFIVSVLNFQILPALGTLFNDLRNAGVPLPYRRFHIVLKEHGRHAEAVRHVRTRTRRGAHVLRRPLPEEAPVERRCL